MGHRAPILESGRPMIPDREYRPLLVRLAGSHFLTHGANASEVSCLSRQICRQGGNHVQASAAGGRWLRPV
ncbi:hypothetical protein CBM2633_A70633 [Cupriavidus taiwanensis]|uniref:Uncharacterized protein n=1 Tax=Cupriavidus taiwanensis TaxID=164546 RepID=A0A976G1P4_9BURK|nr:hypothetical protein CBM2615_A260011 [Cupriavidus taiwanensis]SOZ55364.1 hypothetical protein CBM2614_A220078 [Cupriavidus taiwanensis]SOZ57953.1 hypothetical protein CBM2613_A230078 [Cupriavidus taiwanensis]SOZ98239.1 hypothetical protein CBM2626_A150011 [Cupriavidus taiwanensis]SPA05110.1 hypothetical protein CBM2625_A180079 [Cupriavidus taiwanensis]